MKVSSVHKATIAMESWIDQKGSAPQQREVIPCPEIRVVNAVSVKGYLSWTNVLLASGTEVETPLVSSVSVMPV